MGGAYGRYAPGNSNTRLPDCAIHRSQTFASHTVDTGALSHLRVGSSLIDLTAYISPEARSMHAGGYGLPLDADDPPIDAEAGTLDHFAINLAPYDPEEVSNYLESCGFPPFAQGQRYGADGEGYSIYLRDPENNVLELKCGTLPIRDTLR